MLRPSNSLLGSSRAARRANVRADRVKAFSALARWTRSTFGKTVSGVIWLVLLCGLPILYLAASYLALDLPLTVLAGHAKFTWNEVALFLGAVIVSLVGLTRAIQGVPPVAPVRIKFARVMFGLSWVAGLLMTIGDLAS